MVRLTAQDIHNKEFKVGLRGYNINEVNDFLDVIIKDYIDFERNKQQEPDQQEGSPNENIMQFLDRIFQDLQRLREENYQLRHQIDQAHSSLQNTVRQIQQFAPSPPFTQQQLSPPPQPPPPRMSGQTPVQPPPPVSHHPAPQQQQRPLGGNVRQRGSRPLRHHQGRHTHQQGYPPQGGGGSVPYQQPARYQRGGPPHYG
nr:DivIVA domain-containing protein [Pasteuria penetrans]